MREKRLTLRRRDRSIGHMTIFTHAQTARLHYACAKKDGFCNTAVVTSDDSAGNLYTRRTKNTWENVCDPKC